MLHHHEREKQLTEAERASLAREGATVQGMVMHCEIQLPLSAGERVPVRYDPADRRKLVIDVAALQKRALHDYLEREQKPKAPPPARQGTRSGPPWVVPAHCPNCGAPVDQARASADPDPLCPFCHQPVPVSPLA